MGKMTKRQARKILGVKSDYKLAELLGISRQAVSAWGDHLPPGRAKQAREIVARREQYELTA